MSEIGKDIPLNWDVTMAPSIPIVTDDLPPGIKQRMFSPVSSTLISGKQDTVLVEAVRTVPATSDLVPLLIHGFLDKGAVWVPFIDKLGPLRERALAPDFAGAGARAREGGPFTLHRQAADAVALIDQRPDARFVVVGHSMGGQVAELVAQARPERVAALVLMTAVPLAGHESTDEVRRLLRECGGDVETQRRIRQMFSCHLSDADLDRLLDPATLMGPAAAEGYYDAFTAGDASGNSPSTFTGPVLLLAAREDSVVSVEMTLSMRDSRFPGNDVAIVKESGHWPHLEQSERSARAIVNFLSSRNQKAAQERLFVLNQNKI
jgi:pimeloyl-ACP methyl ester carboxylesterase